MNITIVTPASRGSRRGNRVTAERYATLLKQLQHRVRVSDSFDGQPSDLLVALHARKSAQAIRRFRDTFRIRPIVLVLTGTDLYSDLPKNRAAQQSLALADRLVVLQADALRHLPEQHRFKGRTIEQSCVPPKSNPQPLTRCFEVCVSGHLRDVKDPFRAEAASRLLPTESRIRITQIGAALSSAMQTRAERCESQNPRYRWRREVSRWRAGQILARSKLLVVSSKLEGGANVVSEAIASAVPVLASRVSGNLGLLGREYAGYFDFGNTRQLADSMQRAESDICYYQELKSQIRGLQPFIKPSRELARWRELLAELGCLSC